MRIAILVLMIGCSGGKGPPQVAAKPSDPVAIDAAPEPDAPPLPMPAPPVDAAVAIAIDAAVDAAVSKLDGKRPAVTGQTIKIALKQTVTIGGVSVKFVSNGHKHPAGRGRTLGMWGFEIARGGGAKQELDLRSTDEGFEAEVDAKGVLLVFRHVSYSEFELVLAAKQTPKPLSEEACEAIIAKAAVKLGLPGEPNHLGSHHGFVVAGAKQWDGHCGTYTRRVWFTAARRDDDDD
jgi:hypothetical protein